MQLGPADQRPEGLDGNGGRQARRARLTGPGGAQGHPAHATARPGSGFAARRDLCGEAALQRGRGPPAELGLGLAGVGDRAAGVARRGRDVAPVDAAPRDVLTQRQRVQQRDLAAAPDVVDAAGGSTLHGCEGRADNVADVGEVPRLTPAAEHVEGTVLGEAAEGVRERHVRPLPGSVDGEVAQPHGVQAAGQDVRCRQRLAGQLRHAVWRHRAERVVLPQWIGTGISVDRRRGGVDDPDLLSYGGLEDPLRREQVVAEVARERRPPARPHAGPSGQMEHAVDALEQRLQRRSPRGRTR